MESNLFQIPAIPSPPTIRKDRSSVLKFDTRELEPEEVVQLLRYREEGWLLFSPNPLKESDIPPAQATVKGKKTPSQELRAALWVYWDHLGGKGSFNDFYKAHMRKFIDAVLAKV